jgi:hypothetical protein
VLETPQETRISLSHEVVKSDVVVDATTVNVVKQIRRDEWCRLPMQGLQQISQISKSLTQCYIDFLRRGSGNITIYEIPPID